MALWVHLYALGLESPGRPHIMSDLEIPQRLAERAVPPGSRAELLKSGVDGGFLALFQAFVHWWFVRLSLVDLVS
jgi:hypothetical protein